MTGRCDCLPHQIARRLSPHLQPGPADAATLDRLPAAWPDPGTPATWPLPPLTAHRALLEAATEGQ